MGRKLTTEEFIEKARKKHGDKYDYSEVEYVDAKTKIRIFCPEHGPFLQTPSKHLNSKYGCSGCVSLNSKIERTYTTKEFIEKARKIHGDKYDYSEVEYKNSQTKVCIICPRHEPFWQTPASHLCGYGCSKCVGLAHLNTEEFIEKARLKHGDKYDYSMVEYKNCDTNVCIICPIHGTFYQTPYNHLKGRGCPNCKNEKLRKAYQKSQDTFICEARKVHGDKYDYSMVEYVNTHTKVCITCLKHGCPFLQTPSSHLRGRGCPRCNQSNLEILIVNFLENRNISFTYNEYNFEWLKSKARLQLDFYLLDYNVAIECQGEQHFKAVEYFGGERGFKKLQQRDALKKRLCEEHGVKLFYINYDDNVEEKMNEILIITQSQS